MSDRQTAVTKQETLAALRKPGELYVVMSAVTKLPFVKCDEETFDDEIFLYYRVEDAKDKAKELLDQRYLTAVAKLEDRQLLAFYTSLYTMGVNCLAVNHGTDTQISIQLQDLVVRKDPSGLPEGKKVIENPALHLTAIYFMQEMRRQEKPQPTGELKDLQEELLKNGDVYQPVFTDILEFRKFANGKKLRTVVVPAEKIPDILAGDSRGVVVNPLGVNVQLNVARKKKPVKPEGDA